MKHTSRTHGTTTLEKNVTNFVRKFGINRASYKNTFCMHLSKNIVDFTVQKYYEDELLLEHIRNKFGVNIEPFYFVFCLLHEVGHSMTASNFSEEEWNEYSFLSKYLLPLIPDTVERHEIYFNLSIEDAATTWAINYIINNIDECWDFQCKCGKILEHTKKKKSFRV